MIATKENPVVTYHDGGLMFADSDREYPAGWYLYDGESDPKAVTVFEPNSNDPVIVD